jgi:hypothetical protein
MHAQSIISTHPDVRGDVNAVLVRCIEECFSCAQTCISCADACSGEEEARMLRQCIRLDLDCADLCIATGTLASRRTGSNEAILKAAIELCAEACRNCAEECERHGEHHEHCAICAEACRDCETACRAGAASNTPKIQ